MARTCVAIGAVAVATALLGCSMPMSTPPIKVFVGERRFIPSASTVVDDLVQGYVYVPMTPRSVGLSDVLFAASSNAPADSVPASGVAVTVGRGRQSSAQQASPATTDGDGLFALLLGHAGGEAWIRLDFSGAIPEWTREGIGTLEGPLPADLVLQAGLVMESKDLAKSEKAKRVTRVRSFSAAFHCRNTTPHDTALNAWLSRSTELTLDDLFTPGQGLGSSLFSGVPVQRNASLPLYHLWRSDVPANTDQAYEVPWEDIDNGSAACDMLNPKTDLAPDGSKIVVIYAVARPAGNGVVIADLEFQANVDVRVLEADASKGTDTETWSVRFFR